MKSMSKADILFVRACKVEHSVKRLCAVYRRFYLDNDQRISHIADILVRIVQEHLDFKLIDVIRDLHPDQYWRFSECADDVYSIKIMKIFSSKIRYAEVSMFPGFVSPVIFREGRYRG